MPAANRLRATPRARKSTARSIRFANPRVQKGLIWTGSNDGPIYVTRDDGKTWTNVTPKGLEPGGRIQNIEPSPRRAGTAYAAIYRFLLGDFAPYIYRTDDYGKTWTRLTDGKNGIAADEPTRVVREDPGPRGPSLRRHGVWNLTYPLTTASNGKASNAQSGRSRRSPISKWPTKIWCWRRRAAPSGLWTILRRFSRRVKRYPPARHFSSRRAMPCAPLAAEASDARVVTPVSSSRSDAGLLSGNSSLRRDLDGDSGRCRERDSPLFERFHRRAEDRRPQTDAGGGDDEEGKRLPHACRPHSVSEKTLGMHRFTWDLRTVGPWMSAARPEGPNGPMMPPGKYAVKLTVGSWTSTQPFNVIEDPRVAKDGVTISDLQ